MTNGVEKLYDRLNEKERVAALLLALVVERDPALVQRRVV